MSVDSVVKPPPDVDVDAEVMALLQAGDAPETPSDPEPADPSEPTDIAEPTEAASEPAEPAEPTEATDPTEAAEPSSPTPTVAAILDETYGTTYSKGAASDSEALGRLTADAKLGQKVAGYSKEFEEFLAAKVAAIAPAPEAEAEASDGFPELPTFDPRFKDLERMGENADPEVRKKAQQYVDSKLVREDHLIRTVPGELKELRAELGSLKEQLHEQSAQVQAKTQGEKDTGEYNQFLKDNEASLFEEANADADRSWSPIGKQFNETLYGTDFVDPSTGRLHPGLTPTLAMQSALFRVLQSQPAPAQLKAPVEAPAAAMRQGAVAKITGSPVDKFDESLAKLGDDPSKGAIAKMLEEIDKANQQ